MPGILDTFGGAFGLGGASSLLDFGLGMAADAFSRQQDWIYQQKAMEMQYKYDQKAADAAFQRDLNMFNIENEYNSPAQQLARLKSAGLSPALMQGGSSQVAGQMGGSATPSVNANFNGGNTGIGAFMGSFMQNVSAYKQLGLIDAQTDEMLQRVVSSQLSNFIKKVVGKEEWMRIRDSSDTYGFTNTDKDDVDKFFGIGSERAEGAVSPTQTAEDVARSQIKANESSAGADDADAQLKQALTTTEQTLLSPRITQLDTLILQMEADIKVQNQKANELAASAEKLRAESKRLGLQSDILELEYDNEVMMQEVSNWIGFDIRPLNDVLKRYIAAQFRDVMNGNRSCQDAYNQIDALFKKYGEKETKLPYSWSLQRNFMGVGETRTQSGVY